MAALVCEDAAATRLCTATCVAGGTITQLLRASNQGMARSAPKGDLLLAAALSAAAMSATHFQTSKRAASKRKDLIRQSDSRSYSQQAALLSSVAERVCSDAVLNEVSTGPVLHNLSEGRRRAPQPKGPVSIPASNDTWYFNLALQSSLL